MHVSEDQIVDWLKGKPATGGFLGDDAALLERGGPWAVTVDRQCAGVHVPMDLQPDLFARRLLAVNLSDLAAVGAQPLYGFLALAAPPSFDWQRFFRALLRDCGRYGLTLAGGDLSRDTHPSAALTLVGKREPGAGWLTRGAGRVGDRLWVGGSLGESAAGLRLIQSGSRLEGRRVVLSPGIDPALSASARRAIRRHLLPLPQLELGAWLSRRRPRPAAIDISDGLAKDLGRLCRASGVGAVVEEQALPRPAGLSALSNHLGDTELDLTLGGGEDYVLLFTLPPKRQPPARFGCRAIGTLEDGDELRIRSAGGHERPLPAVGWDHLRSQADR